MGTHMWRKGNVRLDKRAVTTARVISLSSVRHFTVNTIIRLKQKPNSLSHKHISCTQQSQSRTISFPSYYTCERLFSRQLCEKKKIVDIRCAQGETRGIRNVFHGRTSRMQQVVGWKPEPGHVLSSLHVLSENRRAITGVAMMITGSPRWCCSIRDHRFAVFHLVPERELWCGLR